MRGYREGIQMLLNDNSSETLGRSVIGTFGSLLDYRFLQMYNCCMRDSACAKLLTIFQCCVSSLWCPINMFWIMSAMFCFVLFLMILGKVKALLRHMMMSWWEGNISNWESGAERHVRGSDFTELEESHLNNSVLNLTLAHKHKFKIIFQMLENMNRETPSIH